MIEQQVEIINRLGLHARAAAKLVQCTTAFTCDIEMLYNGSAVDAKSMLGILLLAAAQGTELTLRCDGDDEEAAVEAITTLIGDRFGEGE